jgi:hypothetical protein
MDRIITFAIVDHVLTRVHENDIVIKHTSDSFLDASNFKDLFTVLVIQAFVGAVQISTNSQLSNQERNFTSKFRLDVVDKIK